jgi:hypothetical protein
MVIHTCNLSTWEAEVWAGGMAQVAERLPSKCESLHSSPSTARKEEEKGG